VRVIEVKIKRKRRKEEKEREKKERKKEKGKRKTKGVVLHGDIDTRRKTFRAFRVRYTYKYFTIGDDVALPLKPPFTPPYHSTVIAACPRALQHLISNNKSIK